MTFIGYCEFCGTRVDEPEAAYPVVGWEPHRTDGGANRIIDRRRLPLAVAHIRCAEARADRRRRGITTEQDSLLDATTTWSADS